jgi:hypothetical protein
VRGAAAASLLLVTVTAACANYKLVEKGRLQVDVADALKERLAEERELSFKKPVPLTAVTAERAQRLLAEELAEDYEPGELARLSRVYRKLGLLPEGSELEEAFLELYGEQLAGFYDPVRRRMVVVTDAFATDPLTRVVDAVLRRDLAGELVLAHELTHALQDQHFGLDLGRGDVGEDDAQLARRAVYEGDATLAGFAVALRGLSARKAARISDQLQEVPAELAVAYPNVPALVRDTAIFQYVAGSTFVAWAYREHGWTGVNALLARPPQSTEQVLHPEKYFAKPEFPYSVRIGGLAPYVSGEWPVAEETTLGELLIRILAAGFVERPRAEGIAAGWDGDRLMALERGGDLTLVWLTAWDTEDDAREFFAGYAEILGRKYGPAPVAEGNVIHLASGDTPYYFERRGTKVLAIEGLIEPELANLADRIWRRSRYDAIMPWIPIDLASGAPACRSR